MSMSLAMALGVGLGQGGAAFDYYVDSVSGNDANGGRSPSQAFATIGALPSLTAGVRIGLAKGSHWREQLTLSAAATIGAYGSGANPIIDASNIVSGWSKTAGKTNIYQATVTAILAGSGWINAWENDAFMSRAASLVALDSAPGSYYVSTDTGSGSTAVTLYVYVTGGIDPTGNGKVYECAARQGCIAGANDVTVTGITTRRQIGLAGSVAVVKRARLTNCRFEDGNIHNCYCGEGSVLTGCVAENSYYAGTNASLYVHYETTVGGLSVTYTSCQALNTRGSTNVEGFLGHTGDTTYFGPVNYVSCYAYNCKNGFGGSSGSITTYTSCSADTCIDGFAPNALTAVIAISCTATNCTTYGFYSLSSTYTYTWTSCLSDGCASGFAMDNVGSLITLINCRHKKLTGSSRAVKVNLGAHVAVDGLVACVNTSTAGCVDLGGDGSILTLTNSVLTSVGVGASNRAGVGVDGFAQTNTLTITGTHFDGFQQAINWPAAPTTAITSDNNNYDPNTQDFIWHGVTYADLATYVAATGQDAHSTGNAVDTAYACV